jgi:hypothetical protein
MTIRAPNRPSHRPGNRVKREPLLCWPAPLLAEYVFDPPSQMFLYQERVAILALGQLAHTSVRYGCLPPIGRGSSGVVSVEGEQHCFTGRHAPYQPVDPPAALRSSTILPPRKSQ